MIRVNLLPAEYRKRDRTPIKVFASLVVGIVTTCAFAFYYADTYFGELATVEKQLAAIKADVAGLVPQVQHHDSLVREKADYEARAQTIHDISRSRISWVKKVDELIDIVNAGEPREDTGDGYLVWFGQLAIAQQVVEAGGRKGAKGPGGGSVRIQGNAATDHMSSVVALLKDLRNDESFFSVFENIEDPKVDWIEQEDLALEPANVMTFPIAMPILGLAERERREN